MRSKGSITICENLISVWVATNNQDGELVGYAQAGARSPAYEPGPYSVHTEMLVEKFSNWYIGRMAAHLRHALRQSLKEGEETG